MTLIVIGIVSILSAVLYFALKAGSPSSSLGVNTNTDGSPDTTNNAWGNFPLKMGSRGNEVTFLQAYINQYFGGQLSPDGIWGSKTQEAFEGFVSKVEFISSNQFISEAEYNGYIRPHESHLLG